MKLRPGARVRPEVAVRLRGRTPIAAALVAAAIGVGARTGAAEPAPEDLLPESELDDPIGVDARTRGVEAAAEDAATRAAAVSRAQSSEAQRYGPPPPPLRTRDGEILTSVRSTREVSHRVDVELDAGLAEVAVELVFTTPVDKPAEVRYRLAVPVDAELASLEVCHALGCRAGVVDPAAGAVGAYDDSVQARGPSDALPVAHAVAREDVRGRAIVLRAAPVVAGRDLTLRVRYVARAPVHDGSIRFTLPSRGMDPYAAPTTVRLRAPGLLDPRIAGAPARDVPVGFDPWVEVPIAARVATNAAPHATLWTFPCGSRAERCARVHVAAGPRAPAPRDLVVALDVSPSTEGPVRGRLLPAVAAVLSTAPEGSRVRVVAFAARARTLVADPTEPTTLSWSTLGDAVDVADLGSATRFEAVWDLAREWLAPRARGRLAPTIVILGDGGLTEGEARPFRAARRAGVEVSVVNLASRATLAPLARGVRETGGVVVEAGVAADAAARGRDAALLDALVSAVFAPIVHGGVVLTGVDPPAALGALRAGHEVSWQGRVGGTPRLLGVRTRARAAPDDVTLALATATGARAVVALAAVDPRDLRVASDVADRPPIPRGNLPCDRRGPARRRSGVNTDLAPIALAEDRACRPASTTTPASGTSLGRGMPADPLLGMLRQRIVPVARGCFRRERAGRADHAVRAVFAFALADREIVSARVEGEIPETLRTCLLGAVDSLDVPPFSGLVQVRYPLRTERAALPTEIELTPSAAAAVDTLLEAEPGRRRQRAEAGPASPSARARRRSASDASGAGGVAGSSSSNTSPRGGSK